MEKMKLILLLGIFCCSANAQTKWNYPVRPGEEKWASFKTRDEMLEALSIPDDVLGALSTDDLIELCLSYPILYLYFN